MSIAKSVLRAQLAVYHLTSNAVVRGKKKIDWSQFQFQVSFNGAVIWTNQFLAS